MPSTIPTSVSSDLASSTVMTPSLPTFCIASAIILPTVASPFEEMVPTWATSDDEPTLFARLLISSTTAFTARSMPRLRSIGFIPAATALAPSLTMACASTVAVVVPSPARSLVFCATSRTICAPIFSNLSSSSISLATVTPSLVIRGAPKDFSMTTLRPFGPSVTFTEFASVSTPRSMRSRASPENFTSLAVIARSSNVRDQISWARMRPPFGHTTTPILLHDQELLAVELDLGARPLAEQHAVTGLYPDRDQFAVLVATAGADGDDLALLRFLFDSVGNDDAALGFFFRLETPDDHPVVQRPKFCFCHDHPHLARSP